MRPSDTRRRVILAGLIAALMAGCGTKHHIMNPGTGPPPARTYPILSDPYNLMDAFQKAYIARDTVEIRKVYDDSYTGTSIDQTNPGGVLNFTKGDEVRHVAALAASDSITRITLQFPPILTRETDLADPPGWATIRLPPGSVRLQIDNASTSHSIEPDREQFEFKFVPATPDSSSPSDTTWKIIRWLELKSP